MCAPVSSYSNFFHPCTFYEAAEPGCDSCIITDNLEKKNQFCFSGTCSGKKWAIDCVSLDISDYHLLSLLLPVWAHTAKSLMGSVSSSRWRRVGGWLLWSQPRSVLDFPLYWHHRRLISLLPKLAAHIDSGLLHFIFTRQTTESTQSCYREMKAPVSLH